MAYADFLTLPDRPAALPAWFAEPRALTLERHAHLGVRRGGSLRFAAKTATAPLVLAEFAAALRHYPIAFTHANEPRPVAVLGLDEGQNLFVDAMGGWRRDHPVPLCLDQYPLTALAGADRRVRLYADVSSGRLVDTRSTPAGDVDPIFDPAGTLSAYGKSLVVRSRLAGRSLDEAAGFGCALVEAGILRPCTRSSCGDAGQALLDRLLIVDEASLRALPGALLAEFARLGWLETIVMTLVAQQNWQSLAQMARRHRQTRPCAA